MNAIMIAGTFGHGARAGSMTGDEILCAAFLAVAGTLLLAAGAAMTRATESPARLAVRYARHRR